MERGFYYVERFWLPQATYTSSTYVYGGIVTPFLGTKGKPHGLQAVVADGEKGEEGSCSRKGRARRIGGEGKRGHFSAIVVGSKGGRATAGQADMRIQASPMVGSSAHSSAPSNANSLSTKGLRSATQGRRHRAAVKHRGRDGIRNLSTFCVPRGWPRCVYENA